ncbi:MAG: amino acid ABC transporter permease [Terrimesophilobacter sp.]
MSENILEGDFGPIARRRTRVASIAVVMLLCVVAGAFIWRFAELGEFAYGKWALYLSWEGWAFLLGGLINTVNVMVVDAVLALIVGALVALGQLSSNRVFRWMSIGYAEIFRSLPTLLLVVFFYFGLSSLGISAFWSIVLGSAIYNSAAYSNIFKAGVLTLDRGQFDAASALGLPATKSMRFVIAPQAFRRMLPSTLSQSVILLKDSSLGFFIGYEELLRRGQIAGSFSQNFMQSYLVVGIIYIIVCMILSHFARVLERRSR